MERLLIFGLGGQEILFIALIVLLLFGGRKIPELMKEFEFVKEMIIKLNKELKEEEEDEFE